MENGNNIYLRGFGWKKTFENGSNPSSGREINISFQNLVPLFFLKKLSLGLLSLQFDWRPTVEFGEKLGSWSLCIQNSPNGLISPHYDFSNFCRRAEIIVIAGMMVLKSVIVPLFEMFCMKIREVKRQREFVLSWLRRGRMFGLHAKTIVQSKDNRSIP